jgi:Right handed beta helix region
MARFIPSVVALLLGLLSAAPPEAGAYRIGSPSLRSIWVDREQGRDSNSGSSRDAALRTLSAAWRRVPQGRTIRRRGYRILLARGRYPDSEVPVYWESRHGTRGAPIVIEAADGPGTAVLSNMNVYDARYLYVLGVALRAQGGDVFHCERCDHLLLRGMTIRGDRSDSQEGLKVNQSRHVYVEHSDISGANDNAVDFVAVQHARLVGNRVHDAADWCGYAKGGSAHVRVADNEFYDCGTGGYTVGQGSGLQWLTPPWLHYEAYDVKVYDNVVHDTEGAGLGVSGGYNVLLAYNTLYRVGSRSHALEFVYGSRSCDGQPGDDGRERCRRYLDRGGWGTTRVDDGTNFVRIPNRNVYVFDNLLYNPSGFRSPDQHFAIAGRFDGREQRGSNLGAVRADRNLRIRGNLIWNGPSDLPLGVGEDAGCPPSNRTCNAGQLRRDNAINRLEPELIDPAGGDFRPRPGGSVYRASAFRIPRFGWRDAPKRPRVRRGALGNRIPRTRAGARRGGAGHPGAY